MKGHYNDIRFGNTIQNPKENVYIELNSGIAIMTPAYLIGDILYSQTAKESTKSNLARITK